MNGHPNRESNEQEYLPPGTRVRFAGGPLHNQLIPITSFAAEVTIFTVDPAKAVQDDQPRMQEQWRHRYKLVHLASPMGCRWLEYHHADQGE